MKRWRYSAKPAYENLNFSKYVVCPLMLWIMNSGYRLLNGVLKSVRKQFPIIFNIATLIMVLLGRDSSVTIIDHRPLLSGSNILFSYLIIDHHRLLSGSNILFSYIIIDHHRLLLGSNILFS